VGLKVDLRTNHLFVAGGFDGTARVYNGDTGEQLATYQLTVPRPDYGPIINDVILTRNKAYFTDSCSTNLFKVSLGPHGALPDQSAVETIPMTGDFKFVQAPFSGLPCFPNANGIVATDDGKWLVIVNSLTEEIFRVNPRTGETRKIDVGQLVPNGDGLLLDGSTLYVVQNFLNQIAVIELSDNLTSGVITDYLTSPAFDVPATAAFFCDSLYAVNARFTTPVTPDTQYDVVKVAR
jgi:sugar lactone lactonase YvrE